VSRFVWIGAKEFEANLRKLAKDSRRSLAKALRKFADTEMKEMKRQTPVEFGTLRDSGTVDDPEWVNDSTLVCELGFGGAAEGYAIYVHEDLTAFHSIGNAKFVERPLNESAPFFMERVGKDWAEDLGLS